MGCGRCVELFVCIKANENENHQQLLSNHRQWPGTAECPMSSSNQNLNEGPCVWGAVPQSNVPRWRKVITVLPSLEGPHPTPVCAMRGGGAYAPGPRVKYVAWRAGRHGKQARNRLREDTPECTEAGCGRQRCWWWSCAPPGKCSWQSAGACSLLTMGWGTAHLSGRRVQTRCHATAVWTIAIPNGRIRPT